VAVVSWWISDRYDAGSARRDDEALFRDVVLPSPVTHHWAVCRTEQSGLPGRKRTRKMLGNVVMP
jgi:hypothetical protein